MINSAKPLHPNLRITFIGGGNMGRALISGLLQHGFLAQQIQVVDAFAPTREKLHTDFQLTTLESAADVLLETNADHILVLAVKPQDFKTAALSLRPILKKNSAALVLSIAAGIRLAEMSRWLDHALCIRAMPNTPALIGQGITALFATSAVDTLGRERAGLICNAVGQSLWLSDEGLMDAVTALSGSGPAYVFAFLEALQAGGEKLGLSSAITRQLAYATLSGATALAQQSSDSPATLRAKVTSKGGTTAAALAVLENQQWQAILEKALEAAAKRGKELGDELSQ